MSFLNCEVRERLKNSQLIQAFSLIDWEFIKESMGRLGRSGYGPNGYVPINLLKALILQAWYSLSDEGLEEALRVRLDFIITGTSKEVLENRVKPIVVAFLRERGLELSSQKTKITHVNDGFDFLGFNVRKYKGKLLIKPSKKNVKSFLGNIRDLIKSNATAETGKLIHQLNPRIRGWANYFSHVVAKETFSYVDSCIFKALLLWIKRRHPNKNAQWRTKKYFRSNGLRNWIFSVNVIDMKHKVSHLDLHYVARIPIRRHAKIRSAATPYDPQFTEYFLKRHAIRRALVIRIRRKVLPNFNVSRNTVRTTGSA